MISSQFCLGSLLVQPGGPGSMVGWAVWLKPEHGELIPIEIMKRRNLKAMEINPFFWRASLR